MKTTKARLAAASASIALCATTVSAVELLPVPKLTGKECLRNFCLGDELGKFKPGTFDHGLPTLRLGAMIRKPADVHKNLAPRFAEVAPELLDEIVYATHTTHASIRYNMALTPKIHAGLLEGATRVCEPLDLVTRVADIDDGQWTVVFRAAPQQMVNGRQAWILTSVETTTTGVFTDAQIKTLSEQLKPRAPGMVHVARSMHGISTRMAWVPFATQGSTGRSDFQVPGQTNAHRLVYGCLSQSALPKF